MTTKLLHEYFGTDEKYASRQSSVSLIEDYTYEVLFGDHGKIVGRVEVFGSEDKAENIAEDWVLGATDSGEPEHGHE
jgi:hypothetical protein